jgi:hypothetical protein
MMETSFVKVNNGCCVIALLVEFGCELRDQPLEFGRHIFKLAASAGGQIAIPVHVPGAEFFK